MSQYTIKIELKSPLHLGSGLENIIIDADVVYDTYGVPYFPGKRFRGLLYESALEVEEMSRVDNLISLEDVQTLFGRNGDDESMLRIGNFHITTEEDMTTTYETTCQQWQYLRDTYPGLFTQDDVLNYYTSLTTQTAIDENGVADEGSLRTMRVVKNYLNNKTTLFVGTIILEKGKLDEDKAKQILVLALENLRYAGSKRNRGFGKIQCTFAESKMQKKFDDIIENTMKTLSRDAGNTHTLQTASKSKQKSQKNQKAPKQKKRRRKH